MLFASSLSVLHLSDILASPGWAQDPGNTWPKGEGAHSHPLPDGLDSEGPVQPFCAIEVGKVKGMRRWVPLIHVSFCWKSLEGWLAQDRDLAQREKQDGFGDLL